MRTIFLYMILFFSTVSFGQGTVSLQDKPFDFCHNRDTSIWNWLEQKSGFLTLSVEQQLFFYWTNLFRKDPQAFFNTVIKEFLLQFPEANTPEVKSLEADLKQIKVQLPFLFPDIQLLHMSKSHSNDLVSRGGVISHLSANGKNFNQRIKEAGNFQCGAENIFIGSHDPLEALIILLIDHKVPNKGHRLNLIDPSFERMGVSLQRMTSKKTVLVQAFACK